MARKSGNPNWGKVFTGRFGVDKTAFEIRAEQLGLDPDDYAGSPELQRWARANRKKRYVPERLLEAWGMEVEPEDVAVTL